MPFYRFRKAVELARGTRAYLSLDAGVTRGKVPGSLSGAPESGGVRPEDVVWIFGTGRTGSTWIAAMLDELPNQEVWFEPRIGVAFDSGELERNEGASFFFSERYRDVWLPSVRDLILKSAAARYPDLEGGYLFVKEPGGSQGAPTLAAALPESRIVLLVRDPRDVVASWLDATRKGGWQNLRFAEGGETLADKNPNAFVNHHAKAYVKNVGSAKRAYDAHEGRKTILRYEDLRADTTGAMREMYSAVGVPVDEARLARAVERNAWESIPDEKKGEGKFYRKAASEGWREDLTTHQARVVERIAGPLMEQFGYL